MPAETALWMRRAAAAVEEAEVLAGAAAWTGVLSRAYYAMYQAAQALLTEADVIAKTHKGVRARLLELQLLEKESVQLLAQAQERRIKADYDAQYEADEATARAAIDQAKRFLAAVQEHLP